MGLQETVVELKDPAVIIKARRYDVPPLLLFLMFLAMKNNILENIITRLGFIVGDSTNKTLIFWHYFFII